MIFVNPLSGSVPVPLKFTVYGFLKPLLSEANTTFVLSVLKQGYPFSQPSVFVSAIAVFEGHSAAFDFIAQMVWFAGPTYLLKTIQVPSGLNEGS